MVAKNLAICSHSLLTAKPDPIHSPECSNGNR